MGNEASRLPSSADVMSRLASGPTQEEGEQQEQQREAEAPAADAPKQQEGDDGVVIIKRKGQDYRLSAEKARQLASMGLDYNVRQEELKAREAALQKDEAEFQRFKALEGHLAENPEVEDYIRRLLKHHDEFGVLPETSFDIDPSRTVRDPQLDRKIRRLETELAERKKRDEENDRQERVNRLAREMAEVVENDPILLALSNRSSEEFGRDLALEELSQAYSRDPSVPLSVHAESISLKYAERLKAAPKPVEPKDDYVQQKKQERKQFRSVDPGASAGGARFDDGDEREGFNGEDLKKGRLKSAVAQRLRGLPSDDE